MDFIPITQGDLNAHVSMILEPRRTDPAWRAAYHDAYALAETVWPTRHAHSQRDIYALLAADLYMEIAQSQPEPAPPAPQHAKPPAKTGAPLPRRSGKVIGRFARNRTERRKRRWSA